MTTLLEKLDERMHRADLVGSDDARPEVLYHFTDAPGLAGILSTRELWLSSAKSLNDKSEVQYGLAVARERLSNARVGVRAAFVDEVLALLDGRPARPDDYVQFEAFSASLCASTENSLQWLHYGHRGAGFALGFLTADLASPPCVLRRIHYDRTQQIRLMDEVIELFESLLESGAPPREIQAIALSCAASLQSVASRIKDPRFSAEDEWRLLTWSIRGNSFYRDTGSDVEIMTRFRASVGRVIPYIPYRIASTSFAELVLGFSAADDESTMQSIIAHSEFGVAKVRRSSVPVR